MKHNHGFLKTNEDPELGWIWNGYPIKILGGTEVKIKDNKYNITPGIRKKIVDSTYKTAKSMTDMDKLVFRDMLKKSSCYSRIPTKGRISGCDKHIKNNLDDDVRRLLKLDTELSGRRIKKIIIHSTILEIYTRLEILLGLNLSGHTDTMTEASNLTDDLFKRGEKQKQKQYRNALDKLSTQ